MCLKLLNCPSCHSMNTYSLSAEMWKSMFSASTRITHGLTFPSKTRLESNPLRNPEFRANCKLSRFFISTLWHFKALKKLSKQVDSRGLKLPTGESGEFMKYLHCFCKKKGGKHTLHVLKWHSFQCKHSYFLPIRLIIHGSALTKFTRLLCAINAVWLNRILLREAFVCIL